MRPNQVKAALRRGGVALGTMVFEFKTNGIGRIAAKAGADFVLFDTEHTGGAEKLPGLIAAMRSVDAIPMVRAATTFWPLLSAPLDAGAMGLMVPMVEGAEQARSIVRIAKYPPVGRRGAAFAVAHDDYEPGDNVAKMRSANDEILLIAQIETADGLVNVEEIAAVDGIDVLWIGHYDLTNSLGIPGQFQHPTYLDALDRCVRACDRYGKAAGFMSSSVRETEEYLARGFRIIAYWGDQWIYADALQRALGQIRAGISDKAATAVR